MVEGTHPSTVQHSILVWPQNHNRPCARPLVKSRAMLGFVEMDDQSAAQKDKMGVNGMHQGQWRGWKGWRWMVGWVGWVGLDWVERYIPTISDTLYFEGGEEEGMGMGMGGTGGGDGQGAELSSVVMHA